MAESVGHFLRKFPIDTMHAGDHYITNDPWLGTGHLHDLTVVTTAFHHGRIVGLFANTAHVIDVGGLGMGPEGRSVFEEGMYIPITRCFAEGKPNETFFDFIRAGSRLPVELEGDVYSLCRQLERGRACRRLSQARTAFQHFSETELGQIVGHGLRQDWLVRLMCDADSNPILPAELPLFAIIVPFSPNV